MMPAPEPRMKDMDLLLWRHAEAVDGTPDHTRELTPRGLKQARRMARWLDTNRPKQLRVLVSPTMRTRQTAAAFADDFERLLQPPEYSLSSRTRYFLLLPGTFFLLACHGD